jgi:hypothetical protein
MNAKILFAKDPAVRGKIGRILSEVQVPIIGHNGKERRLVQSPIILLEDGTTVAGHEVWWTPYGEDAPVVMGATA